MSEFHPCRVLGNLYISGILGVTEQNVYDRKVRLIVDLTTEHESLFVNGVETLKIEIYDDPSVNISLHFDTIAEKIEKVLSHGHGVLVHCMAGISRSATICIAYLIKYRHMSLLEAYKHLKGVRPQIRPNAGFFEQLIDYEKMLNQGQTTVKMVNSAIGRIPDVYKSEQDSPLGYFWPLDPEEISILSSDSEPSVGTRNSEVSGSGNEADDEASMATLASQL